MGAPIPTLVEIGATIPRALDDVIARALSRDLDTRYATALALAQAIERGAGPENIGTHADVARLMEAVFGARMAVRQEQVRGTIGHELADLLRLSGLPAREAAATSLAPEGELLAKLAPPMPTGRYALGTELRAAMSRLRPRGVPWRSIAAVGAGVAIGAAVTLTVLARRTKPPPIVVRSAAATVNSAASIPTTRRVLLPLPFLANRATLDDDARDLEPPTDIVAFEVQSSSGARHRITMVAPDGTRAEGYAVEEDGIARPEGDGYAFVAPAQAASGSSHPDRRRHAHPVGVVHDGFTKLH
jgi:hypothetical protein